MAAILDEFQKALQVGPARIDIAYQRLGNIKLPGNLATDAIVKSNMDQNASSQVLRANAAKPMRKVVRLP